MGSTRGSLMSIMAELPAEFMPTAVHSPNHHHHHRRHCHRRHHLMIASLMRVMLLRLHCHLYPHPVARTQPYSAEIDSIKTCTYGNLMFDESGDVGGLLWSCERGSRVTVSRARMVSEGAWNWHVDVGMEMKKDTKWK